MIFDVDSPLGDDMSNNSIYRRFPVVNRMMCTPRHVRLTSHLTQPNDDDDDDDDDMIQKAFQLLRSFCSRAN